MDSLTVIIPTFNRARVLKLALGAYFVQSSPNAIRELIVVDDGSTDGTDATVDEMSRLSPLPIRCSPTVTSLRIVTSLPSILNGITDILKQISRFLVT
jgi:glycosyltransferase involved in cell wall biosynthesis